MTDFYTTDDPAEPFPAPHPDLKPRQNEVNAQINAMTRGYRGVYVAASPAVRERLLHPRRLHTLIADRVAKTGRVRFKKAMPPLSVFPTDREPAGTWDKVLNESWLFWTLKAHSGYGAYRPIDSLVMANSLFGRELYRVHEDTIDLLRMIDRGASSTAELVGKLEAYFALEAADAV